MLRQGLLVLLSFLFAASIANAAQFDEGIEYTELAKPVKTSQPNKVVVTEMFWYGCPHCFRFEPYLERWQKTLPDGVVFEQMPSVLNPGWMEHARAFFALQVMGETERTHTKILNAMHIQNKRLNSVDTMAEFVAGLGVDEKQFREHYHSFPVDTMVRKSRTKERKYGHKGVPAVIINGKYLTSASQAGSNARVIDVINFLVNKELAAQK